MVEISEEERLDQALRRAAEERPHLREIAARARVFDELQNDEHWRALFQEVERKEQGWLASLASKMMRGEPVNQREIDFKRGYYAGAKWAANIPYEAMRAFEDAVEKAWSTVQNELEESS